MLKDEIINLEIEFWLYRTFTFSVDIYTTSILLQELAIGPCRVIARAIYDKR